MIQTKGLTKKFKELRAVDNLSLSIGRGEIFGFLGLNGAGKTTTIRLLLAMLTPTSGHCYLQGRRVDAGKPDIWRDVGYIVETPPAYPELTVRENLQIMGQLRGITGRGPVQDIIKKLGLRDQAAKKARHLSTGNRQRLGLAKALIHKPKILLLDEPTNGLDPAGIIEISHFLRDLSKNYRVTILMSSHKLDEISRVSTQIGIIHQGQLIKQMRTGELDEQLHKTLLVDAHDKKAAKSILSRAGLQGKIKTGDSGVLEIRQEKAVQHPEAVATLLCNAGHPPTLLKVKQENLEMYFMRLIKESEASTDA